MTKRRMMFIPEVNPESFVFFFEKGNSGTSWSIRDYSIANRVKELGPRDFRSWSADDIHIKAKHSFDAPTVQTGDLAFWHKKTLEFNERYLGRASAPPRTTTPLKAADPVIGPPSSITSNGIPVLNLETLTATRKGRKAQDMERILHSPNSEDWVTWNFFEILLTQYPAGWWGHIVSSARRRNPNLHFPFDDQSLPALQLWKPICSPPGYEARSRERMRSSGNPEWIARANSPESVEGASEIDIAFEHDKFLVFAEAKLGSDISMSTTYDPARNQIVRNIDCLVEEAGEREPLFWILVRDEDPARAYVQLMNSYKNNPALLARELPHRSAEVLARISRNLTILLWRDFSELACGLGPDPTTNAVKRELERRICV